MVSFALIPVEIWTGKNRFHDVNTVLFFFGVRRHVQACPHRWIHLSCGVRRTFFTLWNGAHASHTATRLCSLGWGLDFLRFSALQKIFHQAALEGVERGDQDISNC